MTLLLQGFAKQPESWFVNETKSPGYSRVYYITGGEAYYSDTNHTVKLKLNTLYIFPSCKCFKISHDKNNPICCLWFHLDLFPSIIKDLIEIPVVQNQTLYHLLYASMAHLTVFSGNDSYFLSLVNALTSYFYENKLLTIPDESMVSILSYINANYKTAITIEQISAHFHYTTEHFIRMFQKKASITPYQYLTNCKMAEAVRLLSNGATVCEAAANVGYTDSKTFSHAFKQKYDIPPSKYTKYFKPMA